MIDFRAEPSYLRELNASPLGMLRAAERAGEGFDVEVVMRAKRGHSLGGWAQRLVQAIANRPNYSQEFERFSVKGYNPDVDDVVTLDLLKDRLVSEKTLRLDDAEHRAIDSDSAYAAIAEAYRELRPDIRRAAGIMVWRP